MYKLTYESDDCELNPDVNEKKKSEKEIVIYERSESTNSHHDQQTSTMKTNKHDEARTSFRYSAFNDKKEEKKQTNRPNFLSSLSNSQNGSPRKRSRSYKGFEFYCLTFYLLLLTAAVIVSFIYLSRVQQENEILKKRLELVINGAPVRSDYLPTLSNLEEANFGLEENEPTKEVKKSCCDPTSNPLRDLTAQLSQTSEQLGLLEQINQNNFQNIARHMSQFKARLNFMEDYFNKSGKGIDEQQIKKFLGTGMFGTGAAVNLLSKKQNLNKTVAFSSTRLADSMFIRHNEITSPMYKRLTDEERKTLAFSQERINKKVMNPFTGVFTVPSDGIYVLFVSFCFISEQDTELLLLKNGKTIRNFKTPVVSSGSLILNFLTPPMPFFPDKKLGKTEANQYYQTVIEELKLGDKVKLKLKKGALVEQQKENPACTGFSGYKI